MKNSINKLILGIGIVSLAAFSSCSKENDMNNADAANAQATQSFLKAAYADRLLTVQSATDDGVTITDKFSGLTFNLLQSASTGSGQVKVWNDLMSETGTWSSTTANRITFSFPLTRFPDLVFFNKEWLILNNSSESLQLQAANGENDAVTFVGK
jgi:hypothetical protein